MGRQTRVLIAGAGIGGLTAALSLLQKGFAVDVFEKSPELGEVGAGLQNSPNAVRVLHALGLSDEVTAACFNPRGREMRLWDTGESCSVPTRSADMVEKFGFPHITMHRADLHRILADAVRKFPSARIHLGAACTGFEQDTDGVDILLEGGGRVRGDALVGSDGIHSSVRKQLFGASKAQFTGGLAWRGVIPVERLPEPMRQRLGQNWIGPKGHFIVYPIRRGELINVVGHTERDDWQIESWIEHGDPAEFAADFKGWHEEIQILIRNIDIPYKWALFLHPTLPEWSVGRVTLLGDACHPMVPYLAQGANMAIEDGFVLARAMAAYPGDVPDALRCYSAARIPRTTRVVNDSSENVKRYHHPALSDPAAAKDYVSHAWNEQQDLRAWIFAYDATTAPLGATA